ncbi:conserved hypothetical protein [Gloeothece citriformis PCC 7424]|uniref:Glycerophosphoryl diester phosphodiesterase membrane domain-containing protein n=1 Tax=Gloeothece citriformis (strain PCC 7424) TaxID=65393 RepID=B7KHV7_GLOC7|nr:hypothetical protein [Gloeothece citriformis]ACK72054.1 conserved hypothetical protein [Gloeothece citriformis PCC 7424]
MSQTRSPLRIGNVISAALRLYRDNLKTYFGISFVANLWLSVPFLGIIVVSALAILLAVILGDGNTENYGVLFFVLILILIPLWIFLAFYCTAKFLVNIVVISRLAFRQLINKPETATQARALLKPNLWKFWLIQFLVGLILSAVNFVWQIIQYSFFILPASQVDNPSLQIALQLLGYLVYLIVLAWVSARFFLPEICFALENNLKVENTLSRSWQLTKGFGWQIVFILIVAGLITMPVYLLSAIPIISASIYAITGIISDLPPWLILTIMGYSILGAILIFIVLNIAFLPFWQAIKGVIYYDLRSRREGLNLEATELTDSDL